MWASAPTQFQVHDNNGKKCTPETEVFRRTEVHFCPLMDHVCNSKSGPLWFVCNSCVRLALQIETNRQLSDGNTA
jgi:hypothetical protein